MSVKWAAVVVAAWLVAGCGNATTESGHQGAPTSVPVDLHVAVEPSALLPPGAELIEGVPVQEGSWLVGSTFPTDRGDDSWQSLLVIDGEPLMVWDRYARALGLDDRASARQSCVVMRVGDPPPPADEPVNDRPPTRFTTDERIEGENRVACRAVVGGMTMVLGYGPSYSPDVCHRPDEDQPWDCRRSTEAHLYLSSEPDDGYTSFATDELRFARSGSIDSPAPVPAGAVVAPAFELASETEALPGPGEPLGGGHVYGPDWRLPEGGRGVVATVSLGQCTGSMATVVAVPGRPADAVESILADASDERYGPVQKGTDARGRDWALGTTAEAGGLHVKVVALATTDDASSVIVTSCND